jgi:ComF family protein
LHQLKYRGIEEISSTIGHWHGAQLQQCDYMEKPDIITYVPLHKSKLRTRGYNQVEGYATAISKTLNIPVNSNLLLRERNSKTQTKKGRYDRWQNVNEIFSIKNTEGIQGKHILLTDDVVTTGATLEACGNRLLEAGAKAVSFAAMATA